MSRPNSRDDSIPCSTRRGSCSSRHSSARSEFPRQWVATAYRPIAPIVEAIVRLAIRRSMRCRPSHPQHHRQQDFGPEPGPRHLLLQVAKLRHRRSSTSLERLKPQRSKSPQGRRCPRTERDETSRNTNPGARRLRYQFRTKDRTHRSNSEEQQKTTALKKKPRPGVPTSSVRAFLHEMDTCACGAELAFGTER